MRTFAKANKLEHVLYDVRGPVVEEANRMEEQGMNILKLNIHTNLPIQRIYFLIASQYCLADCSSLLGPYS